MYNSVPMETGFFLASVVGGLLAAFLYDLLRISRRIVGLCDAVVNAQDALFMAIAAVLVFVAAYLKNGGEMRWQGFIGFGLGGGLYALIVKNRILNLGTFLVGLAARVTEKVVRVLLFPFMLSFRAFKKPVSFVMWYTGRSVRRAKRVARIGGSKIRIRLKNASRILGKK